MKKFNLLLCLGACLLMCSCGGGTKKSDLKAPEDVVVFVNGLSKSATDTIKNVRVSGEKHIYEEMQVSEDELETWSNDTTTSIFLDRENTIIEVSYKFIDNNNKQNNRTSKFFYEPTEDTYRLVVGYGSREEFAKGGNGQADIKDSTKDEIDGYIDTLINGAKNQYGNFISPDDTDGIEFFLPNNGKMLNGGGFYYGDALNNLLTDFNAKREIYVKKSTTEGDTIKYTVGEYTKFTFENDLLTVTIGDLDTMNAESKYVINKQGFLVNHEYKIKTWHDNEVKQENSLTIEYNK